MATTQDLLFEIGTEELPALALHHAAQQGADLLRKKLAQHEIDYGEVLVYYTPRRIALCVSDLIESSDEQVNRVKGPAAAVAFDESGALTRAGEGFARSKGVDPASLSQETDEQGKSYVYATVVKPGVKTSDLLQTVLPEVISEIAWPRSQRWGSYRKTFARPIRWIVALLGSDVINFTFADVSSSNRSRGHRLLADHEVVCASANRQDYLQLMNQSFVMVSQEQRIEAITNQVAHIEQESGLKADLPKKTFDEVVNLVEWPTVMQAKFDQEFLQIPSEIITDAMLEHQRYFPLYAHDGKLTNRFLLVSNGDVAQEKVIVEGNERVVRARLSDAAFFYQEDLKRPLIDYVNDLDKITFHVKLGTLREKTMRIARLIEVIPPTIISDEDREYAHRAALLSKADLNTSAVIEFTSLQGVMGSYYALASGEHETVAQAINDHYRPRFAGDSLPSTLVGKLVALCDRLDTIAGIFAAQEGPTGSSDPYAIRRQTIAAIRLALACTGLSLEVMIGHALDQYVGVLDFDYRATLETVRTFFKTRMAVIAREDGIDHDVIDALQSLDVLEPSEFFARTQALVQARTQHPERFERLSMAYARARNLSAKSKITTREFDESLMQDQERVLFEAIEAALSAVNISLEERNFAQVFEDLDLLVQPIDTFFDQVLVMDPNQELKTMRVALLNRFVDVFHNVANLGALHG